ncbi:MAG TPA: hypothetical protein VEZ90_06170, partial [Blastocatellia bacterium]|nr:hypothetical protein [Blastocatellia bacterium]
FNRWGVGGVTQLASGIPIDIGEISFVDDGSIAFLRPDLIGVYHQLDPRRVRTFVVNGRPLQGNFFYDPTAFLPTFPGAGNLGRNVFSGPGINLTSLSIIKRTQLRGSQLLELRADVTNLFNHANFAPPNQSPSTGGTSIQLAAPTLSSTGQVFLAGPGRHIQLSVRYRF